MKHVLYTNACNDNANLRNMCFFLSITDMAFALGGLLTEHSKENEFLQTFFYLLTTSKIASSLKTKVLYFCAVL